MKSKTEDEELEYMLTDIDPPYESLEELKIGRLLDQYGIPFFYKQATIVYDQGKNRIEKPSFTLLSYGGLVIDYIPNNGQDSSSQIDLRKQIYNYNQIPATVLGPPDLDKPNWEESLYQKIKQESKQHDLSIYKGK